MKTTNWLLILMVFLVISCGKENRWDVELPEEKAELKFTDISKDFFDPTVGLNVLQSRYPFFFDNSVENSVWEEQRKDTLELAVFDSVQKTFAKPIYQEELKGMFAYYKHYFPKEMLPQVYTYSSGLQGIYEPVLYGRKEGMLFIALDGFLGSNTSWYQKERVYPYVAKNMNPENIAPSVVQAIGREIIPFNPRQQTFVDLMVDEGKKLILADALLPKKADELKIGYTKEQLDWAIGNEGDIWNYFVEQNMIFSNDKTYKERFLQPGPFSKFLNEIETESPGRIGAWVGWQICRSYLDENPEMTLEEFIQKDTQTIFKESKYKPKKGEGNYAPETTTSNDEVEKYEDKSETSEK